MIFNSIGLLSETLQFMMLKGLMFYPEIYVMTVIKLDAPTKCFKCIMWLIFGNFGLNLMVHASIVV